MRPARRNKNFGVNVHEHCASHSRRSRRRPSSRWTRSSRSRERLAPLGLRHQPQRHRHDVSAVQPDDVLRRRRHGDGHPRRAVSAWPAARRSDVLQLDDDDACADHDLRRSDARVRGSGELDDPAAGRRAGHGAAAYEQLQLLDPAVRVHAAAQHVFRSRRRAGGRLDDVSAAVAAGRRCTSR